ncbi:hypothetical protein Rsub_05254 [Raphidocelis subcapitata]|uniref:Uncharacterized protein n=1 Tax=Raphidocelis subcapitata TaxID=307507 RepID=A0A2V0NZR3_9CHLO|nr:hypothetical protein Rsub_05254 [Raphidocelis subcapitata]|eukprot:GBF92172.1 hypothetical protein Rsub_05254 [Raphidocelis subcapitata]
MSSISTPIPVGPSRDAGTPLGSSPPQSAGPRERPLSSKQLWKRIAFDPVNMRPEEWEIGFVETEEAPERKSGAEAWSLRVHDRVVELPYAEFAARFGGAVPFHRIAFFRQRGAVVWESPELRGVVHPGQELYGSSAGSLQDRSGGGGGSLMGRSPLGGNRPPLPLSRDKGDAVGSPAAPVPLFGFERPPSEGASGSGCGACGGGSPSGARRERPRGGVSALLRGGGPSFHAPPLAAPQPCSRGALCRQLAGGCASAAPAAALPAARAPALGQLREGQAEGLVPDSGSSRGLSFSSCSGRSGRSASSDSEAGSSGASVGGSSDDDGGGGPPSAQLEAGLCDLCRGLALSDGGEQPAAAGAAGPAEPQELRDYSQLPDSVWLAVLGARGVGTRDLCHAARVSRGLRSLAVHTAPLWAALCAEVTGDAPPAEWGAAALRRACRRTELRAARWLDAGVSRSSGGFVGTACVALDAGKAVSGDASAVRVWSHATGRRIATLGGHPGRVTAVAFDDDTLVSGCTGGVLRLAAMDDLRCARQLRHHAGAVTAVALLHGHPITAGEEGTIAFWDPAAAGGTGAGAPIVSIPAEGPVAALDTASPAGHLLSAGGGVVAGWDAGAATRLFTLVPPPRAPAGGDAAFADLADGGGGGFSCVSSGGSLVAAGRAGQVCLWDVRSAACVGAVEWGATAGEDGLSRCAGVQLDGEWKLVATAGGGGALCVWDVRSVCGARPRPGWREPVLAMPAPGRISCFAFHDQTVIAGIEGAECALWTFGPPGDAGSATPSAAAPLDAASAAEGTRHRRKDGAAPRKGPVAKNRENRFPKRRTR